MHQHLYARARNSVGLGRDLGAGARRVPPGREHVLPCPPLPRGRDPAPASSYRTDPGIPWGRYPRLDLVARPQGQRWDTRGNKGDPCVGGTAGAREPARHGRGGDEGLPSCLSTVSGLRSVAHCLDQMRLLPHSAEYPSRMGKAILGGGGSTSSLRCAAFPDGMSFTNSPAVQYMFTALVRATVLPLV